MTQENKIWHTPDEYPILGKTIVFWIKQMPEDDAWFQGHYVGNGYLADPDTPNEIKFDDNQILKWAYVSDLLACSKALEVAIDALKIISAGQIWECGDESKIATKTLTQIKEIMKS